MIILGILAVLLLAFFGLITFIGPPYVPTHKKEIVKAFKEAYTVTPDDLIVDLGSGDGIMLRETAKRGGRAIGYELNPVLWALSIFFSARYGSQIKVYCRNIWMVKLPEETTMVYTFIDARFTKRLAKKLEGHVKRTGKPIRFMSYGFPLPGAEPDAEVGGMLLYTIRP